MSPVEELLHKLVKAPVILVVAQDSDEATRLSTLLEKFHCHPIPTCSIDDAIAYLQGRSVDLLLVDNRIECEQENRLLAAALMENPSAPAVVLTGYGGDELPTKPASGFVGLFPRPFTSRDLEQLFRSLRMKVRRCPELVQEVQEHSGSYRHDATATV